MASLLKGLEQKGVDAGVSAVKAGGKKAASATMDAVTDESRKVSIKITNNSNQKLTNPKIFLDCGVAEELLPLEVNNEKEIQYDIHKKKWTLSGIAGVITYEWEAGGKKYCLAIMFRSPMMSSNSWNAQIYSESSTEANQQLFSTLTREGALKGDNNYTSKDFDTFTLQGAMSSSGTAKLHVIVRSKP